ncbi:MAG: hypothetical protein MUE53_00965 [Chitinophagales bacterium]|jgi:phosphoribosylglycinamide formyltransferase-1|nr:hypothetical protein [Chitinophagales bacterium]
MTIAIITYDYPHRKTQDLIKKIREKGYEIQVTLLALPWKEKKKKFSPKYNHRPLVEEMIYPKELALQFGFEYVQIELNDLANHFNKTSYAAILIAGAGILPDELVLSHTIHNAHPGILPFAKGLDAMKWSIYKGFELGATLHIIDQYTDQGYLIAQKIYSIKKTDTFESIAKQIYDLELELLSDIDLILSMKSEKLKSLKDDMYPVHKRMSPENEEEMMIQLEEKLRRLK